MPERLDEGLDLAKRQLRETDGPFLSVLKLNRRFFV